MPPDRLSSTLFAQWRPCHLEAAPLQDVFKWLESYQRFWERSLDGLAEYLKLMQRRDPNN
jgi:hypothetical protein